MKAISISNQIFPDSINNNIDYFKVKADNANQSVKKSEGQTTIDELNQLTKELNKYFK